MCELQETDSVKINATATTDPKGVSTRRWAARIKAIWDIKQARFVSQAVSPARRVAKDRN